MKAGGFVQFPLLSSATPLTANDVFLDVIILNDPTDITAENMEASPEWAAYRANVWGRFLMMQ